ncbi:kinase-like protein [Rhizodiscina lignyota]|uniref:non-specific serine/threonine protein kinase n=1 Tax=Rhizodiscina lignyota TaxID=1504668 RepID=A0A9P4IHY3_9PEZI|nr:kinase-like protein [Rhizodiscina lignyota]
MRTQRMAHQQIQIHEDEPLSDENETVLDESRDPLAESSGCAASDESDEEVEESVAEDMAKFEESFNEINGKYRLINRIGEGTFSTVYKAEDLRYNEFENTWDYDERRDSKWSSPRHRNRPQSRKPRFVAIKKIYVTSSPIRIFNELELLHDLRDCDSICPLITAFRHNDQVIAVLPFFQHRDFREYFREMTVSEMRNYFQSLFTALAAVHHHGILHRDIKPTNFLYSPKQGRGVLVDFGLAEREGTDWRQCDCTLESYERKSKIANSVYASAYVKAPNAVPSYPKQDERNSRRANRAGTRGFRAPEVLFKCSQQTTGIDVWSAGVILLTFLTKRFPFFHSADDIDALLELTAIFGRKRMRDAALLHGQIMETNIPSYSDVGHSFEKIILWSTDRSRKDNRGNRVEELSKDEKEAMSFMERCFELNPERRITAKEALMHPFVTKAGEESGEEDMVDLVGNVEDDY